MSSAEAVAEPEPPERPPGGPGSRFLAEIGEQPAALLRLLDQGAAFEGVAAEIIERRATTIRMVGHGSSDNAASYGVYAFGLLPGWTALRDSISLTVYYGAALDMTGSTVLALSQSGRTPDVVDYVERARRSGAFTVAITNDPASALAAAADSVLPLEAGAEPPSGGRWASDLLHEPVVPAARTGVQEVVGGQPIGIVPQRLT